MTSTKSKCCCLPGLPPGPCCAGGWYGHILVRRVSEGVYELATPLSIAATIPFFLDAVANGMSDTYLDALFIMPPMPLTGQALLCDEEPVTEGGDIYRARWWQGETAGAISHGPSGDRVSMPATVIVSVVMQEPGVTAVVVRASASEIFEPPTVTCGRIERSVSVLIDARYIRNLPPLLPTPRIRATVIARQSRFEEDCELYGRRCEILEIRGCPDIGTDASAPVDISSTGPVLAPKQRGYFAQCYDIGVFDSCLVNWLGCPPIDYEQRPWEDIADTSSLAATLAITLDPERCGDPIDHVPGDCEAPSGVCVIGGIVRDPVCCQDPSLPGCQDVVFGPCCESSTPTHWTFLPSTFLRMQAWWEIIELTLAGAINRAWFGDIFLDRPTAPTLNSQCQAAQNSLIPSMSPGVAYRYINPPGGTPQLFNNTYQLTAALGRNAALPAGSARLRLQVTDDLGANVVTHDSYQALASILNGVTGVTTNRTVDRRFFVAQPQTAEAFYFGANSYVYTPGNPPSSHLWKVRVFAQAVAFNFARCAAMSSDSLADAAPFSGGLLAEGPLDPFGSPVELFLRRDGALREPDEIRNLLEGRASASDRAPRRVKAARPARILKTCCTDRRATE